LRAEKETGEGCRGKSKERVSASLHVASALALVASLGATPASDPLPRDHFDPKFIRETVNSLAAVVDREYVDPDVAARVSASLRRWSEEGRYAGLQTPQTLAEALTRDLFATTHDRHLVVTVVPENAEQKQGDESRDVQGRRANFGVQRAEILVGNVGLLNLTRFYRPVEARDAISAAMLVLRNADALIVDLRANGGGSPETVALFLSYLFDAPGLPLFDIVPRGTGGDHYTTDPGFLPERDGKRPVYALTSQRTWSAGEGLAFILQERHRAEVIGETTAGAANPGRPYPINARFTVTVPNGKVRSAVSGRNWEGIGVMPDVAVPAARALEVAHARALREVLKATPEGPWRSTLERELQRLEGNVSPSSVVTTADQTLDGEWLSDGYGHLAEVKGGEIRLFEVTPISCLASEAFTLKAEPADARGTRFVSKSGILFLTAGPDRDSEWFHSPDASSKVLFRRIATRPEACDRPPGNDPLTNFDIFAATFAAHHGFLRHRGVDWPALTQTYRAKVNPATTPDDLFDIFKAMIEPLHDMHTFIGAPALKREFNGKRPGTLTLFFSAAKQARTLEILETRYLMGRLRTWCNGHLRYARSKTGLGYLGIDAFQGYAAGGFDEGGRALGAALDEIMEDARGVKGLIIDLRIHRGGADPYGIQVAGRLTDEPYLAFVKRARNDAQHPENWTAPQPSTVRVSTGPRFLGDVVELIGPDTVSAGETFTMALMGRQPRVIRIGENTQGVYSDVLERSLPNGWRFGLPNEVYLTEQGTHFEGRGVPPDIRVPVFPESDLAAGRDGGVEAAMETLRARPADADR
jgi:C-terminal processing protease CtpA/Prc